MKTGRTVILVTSASAMLAAGWGAGGGLVSQHGSTTASAAGSIAGSGQAPASASAPAAAGASGTFDGSSVQTPFGSYQAEITVAAGKITNISMLKSGNSDGTSRQISGYALPQLIQAVLQKQTANVGYVSGASYTTQGFESTVQSAMQAAGLA